MTRRRSLLRIDDSKLRPVNFPVEDGHLLTQREILCGEGCTGDDQATDEQKEKGEEDHKCEATPRNKNEPDDGAECLMTSLTASISRPDEVFGRDSGFQGLVIEAADLPIAFRRRRRRLPDPVLSAARLWPVANRASLFQARR
jgi:hypothetical protein